jgi:hypothetical protein
VIRRRPVGGPPDLCDGFAREDVFCRLEEGREERKKVVLLRWPRRAIIYTIQISSHVTRSHVRCNSQCTM